MNTLKNMRDNASDLLLATAAVSLAFALAAPAGAAVIQSVPARTVFATDLPFYAESRAELAFDASLGTLNGVTLAFNGVMQVNISGLEFAAPPHPATTPATVSVRRGQATVDLGQIAVPVSFTERPEYSYPVYSVRGSASEARAFDVFLPAEEYGSYGAFWADFRTPDLRLGSPSTIHDVFFRGDVTALFDYTPAAGGAVFADASATAVPEPAAVAVLGVGLLGLMAGRRRMA